MPPLNALRVFEVAARKGSFTLAAEELNVTQSAVSKQVATLEDHMGRQLFRREHKTLHLTDAGRMCARAVRQALTGLEHNLSLLDAKSSQRVKVLTDVDFARLWLFPRMPSFERQFPDIQISLETKNFTQPIGREENFDLAISWGSGHWEGFATEPLFTNEVFPVCAPDFFDGHQPDIRGVEGYQLIHDRDTRWWTRFLDHLGADYLDPDDGRLFSQTGLCLEAAARGDGIAIGDEVTTRGFLERSDLILPFPIRMPSPDAYYILGPAATGFQTGPISALRTWLVEEATQHRIWAAHFWKNLGTQQSKY